MSLATYSDLKTSVETWRERVGDTTIQTNAADFITLGEARLTRELPLRIMWVNTPLSGSADNRQLTLPADFAEPKWLKRTDDSSFRELKKKSAEEMHYYSTSGIPREWCINGGFIDLNHPCSAGLTFLFRYRQRYALGPGDATTNWLLTNHPDIYLAAVLVWSGLLIEAEDTGQWNALLTDGIAKLKQLDARADADVELEVDPALLRRGGGRYDSTTDSFV